MRIDDFLGISKKKHITPNLNFMNEFLAAESLLNQVGLVYNSGMMSFSGFLVGIFH